LTTFACFQAGSQALPHAGLTHGAETSYGEAMPSPVGHALGGLIVGLILRPRPIGTLGTAGTLGTIACAAIAPDVDFLWGGHNRETHSIGAALLAGAAVLAWTRGRNFRLALAVTLAWSTHVLFDWLGSDDTPPLGVMALWPLTSTFYFADAFVFEAISRRYWLPNFIPHNAWAVIKETLILGPPVLLLTALRWRARRRFRRPGTT
jgi:membrane-bound metal-dependent hydrolase YbcI (DUF457 family)